MFRNLQSSDGFTEVATNPGVSEADAEEAGMAIQPNAEVPRQDHVNVKVRRISKSLTAGSLELSHGPSPVPVRRGRNAARPRFLRPLCPELCSTPGARVPLRLPLLVAWFFHIACLTGSDSGFDSVDAMLF